MNKYQLIAALIPPESRVVDVGCGRGKLGLALAESGCEVIGIDRSPPPPLAHHAYRAVVHGDIEQPGTWTHPYLEGAQVFVFSDVLEHLLDPVSALRRAAERLPAGGQTIVSLPNVAHWSMRLRLLAGRWQYTEQGILDRTHLRFFTRRTGEALCQAAGYEITRRRVPTWAPVWLPRPVSALWSRQAGALWPEALAEGFVWELRPLVPPVPLAEAEAAPAPSSATTPALAEASAAH